MSEGPLKASELRSKPDLCGRCKRTKPVQKLYMDDPDNAYGVMGACDRCGSWRQDLWSMVRKSVLDKLASL